MKVQIRRNVFETNSSSTHSISIVKNSKVSKYPESVAFLDGEFGWEFETYSDLQSKANYLWEMFVACCKLSDNKKSWQCNFTIPEAVERVTEVLAKHGIKAEFPYMYHFDVVTKTYGDNYTYDTPVLISEYGTKSNGYIDHGSEWSYDLETILNDEDLIMNFLFDPRSEVQTGNDNCDADEYMAPEDFTSTEDTYVFYKGN